jgi:hypothetical protein
MQKKNTNCSETNALIFKLIGLKTSIEAYDMMNLFSYNNELKLEL